MTAPRVRCPVCDAAFELEKSPAPPFCSARCRQIDLNRWLGERYNVPVVGRGDEEEGESIEGEG